MNGLKMPNGATRRNIDAHTAEQIYIVIKGFLKI
jgi:hypothetical protein